MGVIGIDLGTTGARSIVYDDQYNTLCERYEEYPILTPRPGWAEQDAGLWWSLTASVARSAVLGAGGAIHPIRAIGISSQGISFVPVDKGFKPLRNAVSWLDVRADTEISEILQCFDEQTVFLKTGKRASAAYTLPKLLWLKKKEPETLSRCAYILMPHDFLIANMTGSAITDHSLASGTMLYDLEKADWSEEMLSAFKLPIARLPNLFRGGQPAGELTESAAAEMGLTPGVIVTTGGQDQKCAAFAAGLDIGTATVSLGTAAAVTILETESAAGACLPRFAYFKPGVFVREGSVMTAGMALRWLRDIIRPGMPYSELSALAEPHAGASEVIFAPHLQGSAYPSWNTRTRGSFHGLTLSAGVGELVLAVMEAIAFEIKRNIEAVGSSAVQKLRVFGGGANSGLWRQIIADASGLPVERAVSSEMACLGAAMLAGKACGLPAPQKTAPAGIHEPDPALSAYYNEKYARYQIIA